MKNVLKSTLATAAGASALMATSVAAAASFNVVIDKIDLVGDVEDVLSSVTVYEPANNIGASATTTVDLFNATAAAGTSFNLATPADGVYEAVVISFSALEVSATNSANTVDYGAILHANNLAYDTNNDNSTYSIVLGDAGTNLDAALEGTGGAATALTTASPVVVTNGSFTLPTLNIKLPSASVEDTAGGLNLTEAPVISTVEPTTSVNSTDVADLLVDVDLTALNAVTGFVSGTSVLNVGLFTAETAERPLEQTELTSVSGSTTTLSQVVFADVRGTVCPVVWFDADSDDLLDAGEYVAVENTTISSNCVAVAGATDVSYTSTNAVIDNSNVIALAPRTVTLDILLEEVADATTAAGQANAATSVSSTLTTAAVAGEAALGATTDSSLTISFPVGTGITRSFTVDTVLQDNVNDTTIDSNEPVNFILDGTVGAFSAVTGVQYISTTNVLEVSGIPYAITTYAATAQAASGGAGTVNVTVGASADLGLATGPVSTPAVNAVSIAGDKLSPAAGTLNAGDL